MSSSRRRQAAPVQKGFIDYPRAGRGWPWKLLPSWRQVLLLATLFVAMVTGAVAFAYVRTDIPEADAAAVAQTSQVLWSDGSLMGRVSGEANRTNIRIADVPEVLQHAVLAAEDRDFETNSGISPKGIARAFWTNVRGGGTSQGGSTITQQYVRNYYENVGRQRSYQRKMHEAILAVKINRVKSKDEILEDYLNTIWWGRGSYGLKAATTSWLRGTRVEDLNLNQSAFLAAIIQSPDGMDYLSKTVDKETRVARKERVEARFDYVIRGMLEKGWITAEQAEAAHMPKVSQRVKRNFSAGPTGHLLQFVRSELERLGYSEQEIEGGGLRIVTTFDKEAQEAAEAAMDPETGEFPATENEGVHAGLASVDVQTGAIIAMYGGPEYLERQVNDATAKIPPGSTLKPFAIAAALEEGESIYSTYYGNSPIEVGNDSTRNQGDRDYGSRVSLVRGLEDSVNTVFVDVADQIGPEKVKQAIVAAGIPSSAPGLEDNVGVALGTASISPLQMAGAYATFANGGVRAERPFAVQRVYRATEPKKDICCGKTKMVKAFPREVAADVTYSLEQVVRSGTGRTAAAVDGAVAGKTGTHGVDDDTLSAWFVGYSPRVATAVDFYRGEDSLEDLDGVGGESADGFAGGAFPARIWTAYMAEVVEMEEFASEQDFPERACLNCSSSGSRGDDDSDSDGTPRPTPSGEGSSSPSPSPSASGGEGGEQPEGPETTEQPAPEQPAPEQPAPEQPAPGQPAPEQPAPGQPAPEQPAPADPQQPVPVDPAAPPAADPAQAPVIATQ